MTSPRILPAVALPSIGSNGRNLERRWHRRLVSALLLAGTLVACAGDDAVTDGSAGGPPPSIGTGPTAAEIVESIQEAGAEATNPRDNTASCTFAEQPGDSCIGLVTTDQVSVYAWPSEDQANRFAPSADCASPDTPSTGGVRCGETIGRNTLLVGNDSDFPVADAAPYVDAARTAIGT